MSNKPTTDSELQGLIRLIADATIGVTDLVENVHHKVIHPSFFPSTPIQYLITKIAGATYDSIRWGTQLLSGGLDRAAGEWLPLWDEKIVSEEKETIRAALNGVVGDYLEEKDNPLQIKMQFRQEGIPLPLNAEALHAAYPNTKGKVLVLVHGLCMNDLQWTRKGHNHGSALAEALDQTPIYLHYNSGRHISSNGQGFNELLEALVTNWPVPVEELVVVAHSMGGLVTRSALYYGQAQQQTWTKALQKIVFLGTPHHGAPLERIGNYIDLSLEAVPYTQPFARLGKLRSAGITDLRYGNLLTEDWEGKDRFEQQEDNRQPLPLPQNIACYSIAAVIGTANTCVSTKWVGDGLVDVYSALGQQEGAGRNLDFEEENTWVAYETTHFELLSAAAVYERVLAWLR